MITVQALIGRITGGVASVKYYRLTSYSVADSPVNATWALGTGMVSVQVGMRP
jgi:hypothetical protein